MQLGLFIALRQLWARRLLNGIAVLGVALGVLVLIGINGVLKGFHQKFLDNILKVSSHVTLNDKQLIASPSILARFTREFVVAKVHHQVPADRQLRVNRPNEVLHGLASFPEVEAAAPLIVGSAVVAFGPRQYSVDLRGIVPGAQDHVTPISRYITSGQYHALAANAGGIVLGVGVASRIGANVDDTVLVGSPVGQSLSLRVLGIFDAGIPPVDTIRVYVTLKDAQTILGRPDVVGRIELRLRDSDEAPAIAERIETTFGYDAESWQETNANFLALFKQQNSIIGMVVAAILTLGGFGILAVQIMIVLQKTRDIAILRSVGFTRRDILTTVLVQGAIIASLGAFAGSVAGHYLLAFLGQLKIRQEGLVRSEFFMVYEDPRFYFYGAGFALSIGLLASLLPALRASRVEPVEVLRGEIA